MSVFMFVLAILAIAVGIPVIGAFWVAIEKERIKLRMRELDVMGSQAAERVAQYSTQNERLEERVRVLERIVTDKGPGLSDEIEKLRDERVN